MDALIKFATSHLNITEQEATNVLTPDNINQTIAAADGKTVLENAVLQRRWDLVPLLVEAGADVNENEDGHTPLYHALSRFQHESVADLEPLHGSQRYLETLKNLEK